MKKIIAVLSVVFATVSMNSIESYAQVSVQVNIGSQPAWGPTGYDYAQFYYFPDYDFYYDISRAQYMIFRNNIWSYVNAIPASYRFDPYNAYKVVVNQNKPYLYNKSHRANYAKFKGQGPQQSMIRDSKDSKYTQNRNQSPNTPAGNNRQQPSNNNNNRQTRNTNTNRTNNNSKQGNNVQGEARENPSGNGNNQGAPKGR